MRVVEVVAGSGSCCPASITYWIPTDTDLRTRIGALCGSVFLDHRFEDYMKRTLGDETIGAMKVRHASSHLYSYMNTSTDVWNSQSPGTR